MKSDFREELEKLEKNKRSIQGLVNHLTGKMAEYQLMTDFRSKKRFAPSRYFDNVADDAILDIVNVKLRATFQRPDGKTIEIDVLAESDCGRGLAVEVKRTKSPVGETTASFFGEKRRVFAALHTDKRLLPAFVFHGRLHGRSLAAVRG